MFSIFFVIDPTTSSKILFNEAKRRILAVLKIHHGADLEEVLTQVVTPEDEDSWRRIVMEEQDEERMLAESRGRSYVPTSNNLRGLVFFFLFSLFSHSLKPILLYLDFHSVL